MVRHKNETAFVAMEQKLRPPSHRAAIEAACAVGRHSNAVHLCFHGRFKAGPSVDEQSNDGEHIFKKVSSWFPQQVAAAFVVLRVTDGGTT
jgi:hypothetical protein